MSIDETTAALLAQASYNESGVPADLPSGWVALVPSTQLSTGFTGNAFYNAASNTVVIGFGGTSGGADIWTDAQFAVTGDANQVSDAVAYTQNILNNPINSNNPEIVIVGHSLGGFLAQRAMLEYPQTSAIVFNSPGIGGFWGGDNLSSDRIEYYYSNPNSWNGPSGPGFAGALVSAGNVHNLGDLLNSNVNFLIGAEGHPMASMLSALQGNPDVIGDEEIPLSGDVWGNILAEQFRTGIITASDLFEMVAYGQDIFREHVLPSMRDSGTSCFLAGTPITMWPIDPKLNPGPDGIYNQEQVRAGLWTKPIEQVSPTDLVVSFDDKGNMVPGYVPRTMVNESKIILDFHGTWVTPGHVYWCAEGKFAKQYAPLIDILRTDGAVEHESGVMVRAATGCEVGSLDDFPVKIIRIRNGQPDMAHPERLRLGARFILTDAKEKTFRDDVEKQRGKLDAKGFFPDGQHISNLTFAWPEEQPWPSPEDYVMIRSQTTLEDIYKVSQWEAMQPQIPAPMVMDGGPIQPLPAHEVEQMKRNTPVAMLGLGQGGSPMAQKTLAGPGGKSPMNRKARKAAEARQRKAAKGRKKVVH